jgi:hypothetical protein
LYALIIDPIDDLAKENTDYPAIANLSIRTVSAKAICIHPAAMIFSPSSRGLYAKRRFTTILQAQSHTPKQIQVGHVTQDDMPHLSF